MASSGTAYGSAKRWMDLALGIVLLVLTAPLVAVAGLLVWLEDRGPVFYRQIRAGRGGIPFTMVKLRSMQVNELSWIETGQVRTDHPLVTRVGRVIRRLKIDELPQLVSVLRGDMSLVGPRPSHPDFTTRYDALQLRRLEVRPGLTGWAQTNGNTALSWDDRILLDVWYVDHASLALDAKIILRTLKVIATGENANVDEVKRARRHAIGIRRSD